MIRRGVFLYDSKPMITHQGLSARVIFLDLKALIVALYSSALFSNIQESSSLLKFYALLLWVRDQTTR